MYPNLVYYITKVKAKAQNGFGSYYVINNVEEIWVNKKVTHSGDWVTVIMIWTNNLQVQWGITYCTYLSQPIVLQEPIITEFIMFILKNKAEKFLVVLINTTLQNNALRYLCTHTVYFVYA